jgi:hypothetical protein
LEILSVLKQDWNLESVEQHAKGYWTFEDKSFDLRNLKTKDYLNPNEKYEIYLQIVEDKILVKISGNESFYEVVHLNEKYLCVICYFQDKDLTSAKVKLMTLTLSRK